MLIQVLKVGSGLVGTLQPFKLLDIFNGFRTLNVLKNQPELELPVLPVYTHQDQYFWHLMCIYIYIFYKIITHSETSRDKHFQKFFFSLHSQSVSQSCDRSTKTSPLLLGLLL